MDLFVSGARRSALLLVLLGAGAVGGCGGDGEKPLSKSEFIKRGDAICKKAEGDIEKAGEKFVDRFGEDSRPSDKELKAFVDDTFKPIVEGLASDLRDLPPPEGDEGAVEDIYEGFEAGLERVEDDPELIIRTEGDAFEDANKAASDYGLEECSG